MGDSGHGSNRNGDSSNSSKNSHEMLGESKHIKEVRRKIGRIAPYDTSVLVIGESGTGKELVARAVHGASKRKDSAIVTLNCSAIPEGLVESELFGYEKGAFTGSEGRKNGLIKTADSGTLFLDEIGAMPRALQAKLLRALEYKRFMPLGGVKEAEVDFRLIAATNNTRLRDDKDFRQDLYYRISAYVIRLRPLRERPEDITPIAAAYVNRWSVANRAQRMLSTEAIEVLQKYEFPGNIRELQSILERACVESDNETIGADAIHAAIYETAEQSAVYASPDGAISAYPDGFTTSARFPWNQLEARRALKENMMIAVLKKTRGHVGEAHLLLGTTASGYASKMIRELGYETVIQFCQAHNIDCSRYGMQGDE